MRVSAKVDYAVRAAVELAVAAGQGPLKGDQIAARQGMPVKFLESILSELRRAGMVRSQRGAEGGYWLAKPAAEISVADIIRAVEGPLADVRGVPPEELDYGGAAGALKPVWVAARASLRAVLEVVTIEAIATGELPDGVEALLADPASWARR
ncbi:MAG: Rrf2 family transcriptional regulator [Acidimicrobiales bacterium]|nr:Rrf2 family transcriptional regulator [Acidimicrobiales bacterium]MCB9372449.1 Rrf2 family transcriptional regulator [Microthrixaceae bacterium]